MMKKLRSKKDEPASQNASQRKIAGDDDKYGTVGSTTTLASNSSSECGSRTTPEDEDQIRRQFKDIMHEKNIKDPEVLERMMSTTTTQMMRELIRNSNKTDNAASRKSPEALIGALKQMLRADNVLERKQDMVDVKLQLTCQNLSYTCKFAAGHDHESGRTGFELLCDLYDLVIRKLRATRIDSKLEIELIDFLQEVVKCIRSIVNTMSGLGMVLQRSSTACSLLIQTLICLNRRKSPRSAEASPEPLEARLLRADVVKICGLIIMSTLQEDNHAFRSFETTGQQKFFRELTTLAREESKKSTAAVSRFRPFVQCLEFLDVDREDELIYRLLISLNCMITRVADNVPEQAWTEDQMWQMRMRLRSEASRDGWGKYMETLSKRTDKKSVYRVCESYINEQSSDFEHLVAKYENLKAEYDTMDGCFELLTSSASASAVEPILLSIFQLLVLVPEEMAARRAYLKLIECCISEVVLHNAVDPDFETPFVFETPVAEIIEQLQDEETSKKLRQATEAKHAAVAMQFEYWKVLDEFRKESEQLRKHVADPSTPIPAPTKCSLTAPDPSMPAPSTSGLPPITGGPPPPPPPMGLPPITGGPPPPPPMGGIPPVTGGPPPPPPPMGGPGGPPPPPPPPPPPGMLGKGGPPPPPPMGGFGHFVEPPLPEYLSAKKACKVDVPMRKFPWGSNTINPRDIPRESFWVSTNEEKLTSDKLYERLKQRFSSKAPVTALRSEVLNGMTAKKVKVPLVIQDDKVLQRLGILQGSVKMTYVELKNALLEVNEKVLTQEFLGQLRAALPPPEVLKKLAEVDKSQFEEMPEGEQFAASLAAVGGLTLRLDLLEFKMRFEEILNELKPSMSSVMEACEEMRKSTGMRVFLQLALAIGNFMGASTKNHSSVYAFEMRTLTKLVDTKDVENKHTLLHHIIEEMRRADPKIAKFAMKDFHHCVDASRVNADELQRSIAQLKANRNKLENCLKTYKTQSGRDRFEEQMKPFLEKVCKEVATVESMNEKMQRDWTSLTKFYAFNPKKYPMEEFFVDVRTFTEQYTTAWRELESEAEAARVDAKRREKAAQTMKSTRNPLAERQLVSSAAAARPNPRSQAASGRMPTVDSIGVLDELEKATGGEMFLERFLQGARTPRVGIAARTKAGRAALQRQRSRGQETFIGLADYAATPEAATSTATATRTKRTDSETPRHQPGAGGFPRRGAPEAAHGRQSSPLDRVKAVGVSCAVPTGTELRMKVRRKGAPAVPVVATAIEPRTQTSPTHKENREPVLKTSAPTATTTTTTMSTSNPDPDDPHAIPSTDDLLARLSQF